MVASMPASHACSCDAALQEDLEPEDSLNTEDDALLYEDDDLDRNTCMLPLVRFIEKPPAFTTQVSHLPSLHVLHREAEL